MIAAVDDLSLLQITGQPVELFFVDDLSEMIIAAFSRIKLLKVFDKPTYQFFFPAAMYQYIVGRNAHLPGIRKFRQRNSARCYGNVSIVFHNRRTLAAQFECNGYQLL